MADLGKAYVQIIPKAEGITSKISESISPGAEKAGKDAGSSIAGNIKKMIAGAAIGATVTKGIKTALDEGAKLQQSFGGIDTLYGDVEEAAKSAGLSVKEYIQLNGNAADKVKQFATEAAKAGISANDYAEQAVSFGAGLKQAFGGDAMKAAEAANTAILDMADNAAKMGTPLESIQNAYQGFAKGNYTMLDNLKLGYGGTKTEMERLLKDAQEISGVEYNIDNLGDVYDAIHVIQGDLGLTGVAAQEASETFSGSFGAMQAAASNLMANLALGEDVGPSLDTLMSAVSTFVGGNLLPMIGNLFSKIPSMLGQALTNITSALPDLASMGTTMMTNLATSIKNSDGELISKAAEILTNFATAFAENIGPLLTAAGEVMKSLGEQLVEHAPEIMACAGEILLALVEGIATAVYVLADVGVDILIAIGNSIASFVDKYIAPAAREIIGSIAKSVTEKFETVKSAVTSKMNEVKSTITSIWNAIKSTFTSVLNAVTSIVTGAVNKVKNLMSFSGLKSKVTSLFSGIKSAMTNPLQTAKDKIDGIVKKIKGFFPLSIGKIFSNIKLPHISVSGGSPPYGIAGKGSLPSFSVSWNAKGAIVDGATLIGAGEKGPEAILPLSGRYMRPFAQAVAEEMRAAGGETNVVFNVTVNGAENPEQFADRMVRQLKLQARTV